MLDHRAARLALRTRLLTLSVCTTGATSLSATGTGYARAAGSFVTDGFCPGMEITGASFTTPANNTAKTLTAVAATALTAAGCAIEAAGTRTVSVGLPAARAWENVSVTPTAGVPYVSEEYLPGPVFQATMGEYGELEHRPQYVVTFYVPENVGVGALDGYAGAALLLFPPRQALTLSTGDVLRVRDDPAPFRGQVQFNETGWAYVQVTIPLWARSANTI